jgi:glutathione-regulated potassium-efflux system ancillary protein KefC
MIFITTAGRERISTIAALIRRHFPEVKIAARAIDRSHAHELMALGVDVFERETFHSALNLGTKALVALGYSGVEADRLAEAFEHHDERLLQESFELRHDEDAYIGFVRQSVEMLDQVMQADAADAARLIEAEVDATEVETDPEHHPDVDKKTAAGSE